MDLGTLQCLALMGQYSLVTPTRTATYWVVGIACRLVQELGLAEEVTISAPRGSVLYNKLEIDLRRRLFWIILSMDYGLAHSLGRPSALGTTFDHVDVKFFEPVDDRFISPTGVKPGSPISNKKAIAIHFFKMRLLQAEIRRGLYLKKRPEPIDDQHTWFKKMDAKLQDWFSLSPRNDEGSGLSEVWFRGRLNTMILFLYRPSLQIPCPSVEAARKCYKAAIFNIQMHREQIASRTVDLTWIFTQALFMALNTLLWTLSYVEIRDEHPRSEVESYIEPAQAAIYLASHHWPGVSSALGLYEDLVSACLRAYDISDQANSDAGTPSNKTLPSIDEAVTPASMSEDPKVQISKPQWQYGPPDVILDQTSMGPNSAITQSRLSNLKGLQGPWDTWSSGRNEEAGLGVSLQALTANRFPSEFPPVMPLSINYPSHMTYLDTIGQHYSQYLHNLSVYHHNFEALTREQQSELMSSLEKSGASAFPGS